MKTNPLRLPLYILYTLKQVKIFQSRRIKSTVCCSLESNTTLLPGDQKTPNQFKKTMEWKNGAILVKKWLKAQNCLYVHESQEFGLSSMNAWRRDGHALKLRLVSLADLTTSESFSPVHPTVWSQTSLHTIYKSFGQTLYYSPHVSVQTGERDWEGHVFVILLPSEE